MDRLEVVKKSGQLVAEPGQMPEPYIQMVYSTNNEYDTRISIMAYNLDHKPQEFYFWENIGSKDYDPWADEHSYQLAAFIAGAKINGIDVAIGPAIVKGSIDGHSILLDHKHIGVYVEPDKIDEFDTLVATELLSKTPEDLWQENSDQFHDLVSRAKKLIPKPNILSHKI